MLEAKQIIEAVTENYKAGGNNHALIDILNLTGTEGSNVAGAVVDGLILLIEIFDADGVDGVAFFFDTRPSHINQNIIPDPKVAAMLGFVFCDYVSSKLPDVKLSFSNTIGHYYEPEPEPETPDEG